MQVRLPLVGIRVIDFGRFIAGPYCAMLLGDMGADVIRVDRRQGSEDRYIAAITESGEGGGFLSLNRNKRNLTLDTSKPESAEIIRRLVKGADVVVANLPNNVLKGMGLDYESLSKLNPRLIMASLSAFGRQSPLAHKTGYDMIAQSFSGLMHMTGDPDGPPTFVGIGIADVGSGVHTFAAIGYALYHRERTGVGQYIDIAMVDTLYHMHDFGLQSYSISGGEFVPTRMGRYHNQICPAGVYKAPQGWIFILVLDRQWANLVKAMSRPELLDDPRFVTGIQRAKNADQMNPIVQEWLLSFPTDEAVIAVLEENRIACSSVLSVVDTMKHPHYRARNMVRTVHDPILGEVTIPGFPLKFSAYPELPEGLEAPMLGQHGEQVLREVLGYSEVDLASLRESGVLYSDDR